MAVPLRHFPKGDKNGRAAKAKKGVVWFTDETDGGVSVANPELVSTLGTFRISKCKIVLGSEVDKFVVRSYSSSSICIVATFLGKNDEYHHEPVDKKDEGGVVSNFLVSDVDPCRGVVVSHGNFVARVHKSIPLTDGFHQEFENLLSCFFKWFF